MIRLLDIVRYPDDDRSLFDGSDYGDSYDDGLISREFDDVDSINAVSDMAEKAASDNSLMLWGVVVLLALAIVIFLAIRWRKRKNKNIVKE